MLFAHGVRGSVIISHKEQYDSPSFGGFHRGEDTAMFPHVANCASENKICTLVIQSQNQSIL